MINAIVWKFYNNISLFLFSTRTSKVLLRVKRVRKTNMTKLRLCDSDSLIMRIIFNKSTWCCNIFSSLGLEEIANNVPMCCSYTIMFSCISTNWILPGQNCYSLVAEFLHHHLHLLLRFHCCCFLCLLQIKALIFSYKSIHLWIIIFLCFLVNSKTLVLKCQSRSKLWEKN